MGRPSKKIDRVLEQGNVALIIVLGLAGIAGLMIQLSQSQVQSAFKVSGVVNANETGYEANVSGLGVAYALSHESDGLPAVYPDPYIPMSEAKIVSTKPGSKNSLWTVRNNSLYVKLKLYLGGKPQKALSRIRYESFRNNDNTRPFLIQTASVSSEISVPVDKGGKRKIVTNADVEIAPPPNPDCRIVSIAKPTTQKFLCTKGVKMVPILLVDENGIQVLDPETGDPVYEKEFDEENNPIIDEETGKPKLKMKEKREVGLCGGANANWDVETDFGPPQFNSWKE